MPQIIKHIDKIAREKNRDVLFLDFCVREVDEGELVFLRKRYAEECPVMETVQQWLKENNIKYELCGRIADERVLTAPHINRLYVDVPFDEENPDYKKLSEYLENEDGSMKIEGVDFMYLPLEVAMKNKHHDEPGFWDKWAEDI